MELRSLRESLETLGERGGWIACTPAQSRALAEQLQRELGSGHALCGRDCAALAVHGACDKVLYLVREQADQPASLAVVQLTWHVPRDPSAFPWTTAYASLEQWLETLAPRPAA